jgi:hypothetical protein
VAVQGFSVDWWVDVVMDVDFSGDGHYGAWVLVGVVSWVVEAWLDYSGHLKCVMLFLCSEGSTSVSKD